MLRGVTFEGHVQGLVVTDEPSDTLTCRESDHAQPGGSSNHVCCVYGLIDVVTDVFKASPGSLSRSPSRKTDGCEMLPSVMGSLELIITDPEVDFRNKTEGWSRNQCFAEGSLVSPGPPHLERLAQARRPRQNVIHT